MSVFRYVASFVFAALLFLSGAAWAQTADLAISQSVSDATPNVGDTIRLTVTLTNIGPDTATGVTVQDLLPASLTFLTAAPSQGAFNSGTGAWAVGSVLAGASPTLQIQAIVVNASTQINTATVSSSDQPDPNPMNNAASITVTPQQADLTLTQSVSDATPNVGDTIALTVTLTNSGPNAATGVTVQDLLPAGLTFVSATPSQGTYNGGTGAWTVGSVSTGTPQTLQIQAHVTSASAQTNTATITHSDQFDPNPANNSANVTATPSPLRADLVLTQSVSNGVPNVGDTIIFTVTLTNSGPNTATGVTAQDLLPAGLTLVSAASSQGSYNSGTGVWTLGTIASGSSATLTLAVKAGPPAIVTNSASVSHSDQLDPNTTNNTSSATVRIGAPAAIPTLSENMLLILVLAMGVFGMMRLRT